MVAVRIGPDVRMAVVGTPAYFAGRRQPRTPQDLTAHACINLRLPTYGGIYAWEFEKRGRELKARVDGQFIFNNIALRLNAALAGFGMAYLPEDQVLQRVEEGRLIRVLEDWCPPFPGLPPLLSEPPTGHASVLLAGGRGPLPWSFKTI